MHREGRCVCRWRRCCSFGSAWLCVLERGARGCATPLAPARGPRCKATVRTLLHSCRHQLVLTAVVRHSTFCQDTVQDTLLWLHPCGPTVDRLRRSTVGSGTREDVVTAYEMSVLPEVVYIVSVPAVFTAPAPATSHQHLQCLQRFSPLG